MDDLIKQGRNYRIVSADMPQLNECQVCGMNTRTEWIFEPGWRGVWACKHHALATVKKRLNK